METSVGWEFEGINVAKLIMSGGEEPVMADLACPRYTPPVSDSSEDSVSMNTRSGAMDDVSGASRGERTARTSA